MDISGATKVLQWNRWLLGFLGLWPSDLNNGKFIFFFAYTTVQCFLQYSDLIECISDLSHIVENLTETVICSMLVFKIAIYRINTRQLRELIRNIEKDFSIELYHTTNELSIFLKYNSLSKTIVQCCSIMSFSSAALFYIQPLTTHLLTYNDSTGNSSSAFVLPYHIRLFFNVTKERTYYIIYAYEALNVPMCACAYFGPICLLITLLLHICGQMSILTIQVKSMIEDPNNVPRQLKQIVIKHCRLLSFFENLQSVYSTFLLQEIFGITLLMCVGCYNAIATSVLTDSTYFFKFLIHIICLISQLFGLCYIGECLVTESTCLCNAFYDCEWYNVPPKHAKLFLICLLRSQKPVILTAGKIFTISLESFTTVMKTSMAYLSVLRNFV